MQGTEHIMIFKQIGGKAEAKAKCNLVPLTEKAKTTEQRYTENAKNERVLVEMTFRGDTSKHVSGAVKNFCRSECTEQGSQGAALSFRSAISAQRSADCVLQAQGAAGRASRAVAAQRSSAAWRWRATNYAVSAPAPCTDRW